MRNKKKSAILKAVLLILAVLVCACVCNPINAKAEEANPNNQKITAKLTGKTADSTGKTAGENSGDNAEDNDDADDEDAGDDGDEPVKSVTAKIPVYCEESKSEETFTFKLEGELSEFAKIENEELKLKSGEKGYFEITFTYPGNYLYSAAQIAGSDSKTTYDNTTYQIDVYVTEAEDGTLSATPVLYKKGSDAKVAELNFKNIKEIPETNAKGTDPAKTGDKNHVIIWAGIIVAYGIILVILTILRNKRRREAGKNERY